MEHTFEELKKKTVAQLREIAKELNDDALSGHTTMHKADLLKILCQVLGIEAHEHHEVVGVDKSKVKTQIRELKAKRDAILELKDRKKLKAVRREIRGLKRKLRKATV
jgi:hypothetical protein